MSVEKILKILLMTVSFILSGIIINGFVITGVMAASSNAEYMWYYLPHEAGKQPAPMEKAAYLKEHIANRDVYYAGGSVEKIIYLTFDDCPSNGNIPSILDTLESHNAQAAFFMTEKYIKDYPEVIKRISNDGCLVCNHTADHISVTRLSLDSFEKELRRVEDAFKYVTGDELPRYFRPPQGMFNENTLDFTQQLRYITIFWSFRYVDWEVNNQPSEYCAIKTILSETHPGEIALLHCQSNTNVNILDEVLSGWEELGYTLESLDYLTGKTK
jgi:peptidoglycan-N-acetylmuramic acid deacetylase